MANDQKPPAKTIMGWSPNLPVPPGQQPPAPPPGQPPQWGQPQPPPAYPPPPQGYPPQPQGYPPPQDYPPQQGYPPPQPPVTWGAPPEQPPGYPPPPAFPPQPGSPPPQQQPYPPQPYAQQPQTWGAPPPQPGGPPHWGNEQPAGMPHPSWNAAPQSPVDRGRPIPGADATHGVSARLRFIRLTYLHLFGAIAAFAGIEWLLFKNETLFTKVSTPLINFALGGRANWAAVLIIFMVVSIGTHWLAEQTRSKPLHYIGLGIYVIAEALIFVPLLAIVSWKTQEIIAKGGGDPNIVRDAAYITLGVFAALTISVFVTKKDFSFLRTALVIAGAAAMGLIALSLIFGFNLGIVFAIAMVLLAAGQILYETSQVMAHYDPEDYVGASLSLFASVALMFWYVIRIVMKLRE